MEVRLTVLVENTVQQRGLLAEHGLSYGIDFNGRRVIFDTAQSADVLENNARKLNYALDKTEAVVISHGHFDHTGGLPAVLNQAPQARVFLHPEAFRGKFQRLNGRIQDFGAPQASWDALEVHAEDVILTTKPTEVVPGLFATGEVPRTNDYETTGGEFYRDLAGSEVDPIADDQALYFLSKEGIVIILGCAHAGVINTIDYVRKLLPGHPLAAVVGGMHLFRSSTEHRRRVGREIIRCAPKFLAGCHCSGPLHLLFPEPGTGIQLEQAITASTYQWTLN